MTDEWAEGGIYRAAIRSAIDNYAGPDDDTVPVLLSILVRHDFERARVAARVVAEEQADRLIARQMRKGHA